MFKITRVKLGVKNQTHGEKVHKADVTNLTPAFGGVCGTAAVSEFKSDGIKLFHFNINEGFCIRCLCVNYIVSKITSASLPTGFVQTQSD